MGAKLFARLSWLCCSKEQLENEQISGTHPEESPLQLKGQPQDQLEPGQQDEVPDFPKACTTIPATAADGSPSRASTAPSESTTLQSKLKVPYGELTFHALIGKGSFKQVYRGKWNNTNVAIVAMRRGGLVTEARLMQQLGSHPNLVQFYRWSTDHRGNEYVVVELVPFGSLDKVLTQFGPSLRNRSKLMMCEQVCHAMCELAAEGVLHRDLAARNILVQSMQPVHVKVSDFGLARVSPHQEPGRPPGVGPGPVSGIVDDAASAAFAASTAAAADDSCYSELEEQQPGPHRQQQPVPVQPEQQQQQRRRRRQRPQSGASLVPVRWSAPEVLRAAGGWSEKSDVYSYGIVMWEIFSNGAEPYANRSDVEAAAAIVSGDLLPRPKDCPHQVYSLMRGCWHQDPVQRPSFRQITSVFRRWREMTLAAKAASGADARTSNATSASAYATQGCGRGGGTPASDRSAAASGPGRDAADHMLVPPQPPRGPAGTAGSGGGGGGGYVEVASLWHTPAPTLVDAPGTAAAASPVPHRMLPAIPSGEILQISGSQHYQQQQCRASSTSSTGSATGPAAAAAAAGRLSLSLEQQQQLQQQQQQGQQPTVLVVIDTGMRAAAAGGAPPAPHDSVSSAPYLGPCAGACAGGRDNRSSTSGDVIRCQHQHNNQHCQHQPCQHHHCQHHGGLALLDQVADRQGGVTTSSPGAWPPAAAAAAVAVPAEQARPHSAGPAAAAAAAGAVAASAAGGGLGAAAGPTGDGSESGAPSFVLPVSFTTDLRPASMTAPSLTELVLLRSGSEATAAAGQDSFGPAPLGPAVAAGAGACGQVAAASTSAAGWDAAATAASCPAAGDPTASLRRAPTLGLRESPMGNREEGGPDGAGGSGFAGFRGAFSVQQEGRGQQQQQEQREEQQPLLLGERRSWAASGRPSTPEEGDERARAPPRRRNTSGSSGLARLSPLRLAVSVATVMAAERMRDASVQQQRTLRAVTPASGSSGSGVGARVSAPAAAVAVAAAGIAEAADDTGCRSPDLHAGCGGCGGSGAGGGGSRLLGRCGDEENQARLLRFAVGASDESSAAVADATPFMGDNSSGAGGGVDGVCGRDGGGGSAVVSATAAAMATSLAGFRYPCRNYGSTGSVDPTRTMRQAMRAALGAGGAGVVASGGSGVAAAAAAGGGVAGTSGPCPCCSSGVALAFHLSSTGGAGVGVGGLCESCMMSMELETAIDPLISCSTVMSSHRGLLRDATAQALASFAQGPGQLSSPSAAATALALRSGVFGVGGIQRRVSGLDRHPASGASERALESLQAAVLGEALMPEGGGGPPDRGLCKSDAAAGVAAAAGTAGCADAAGRALSPWQRGRLSRQTAEAFTPSPRASASAGAPAPPPSPRSPAVPPAEAAMLVSGEGQLAALTAAAHPHRAVAPAHSPYVSIRWG